MPYEVRRISKLGVSSWAYDKRDAAIRVAVGYLSQHDALIETVVVDTATGETLDEHAIRAANEELGGGEPSLFGGADA